MTNPMDKLIHEVLIARDMAESGDRAEALRVLLGEELGDALEKLERDEEWD